MDKLHKDDYKQKQLKRDRIKEGYEENIEVAEKLKAMLETPGWKILENYLDDKMNIAIIALTTSATERDIYYNQAVLSVIKEMLEKMAISKKIGKDSQEILNQYEK